MYKEKLKCIVAGSRTFNNYFLTYLVLSKYFSPDKFDIVVGGARGADHQGRMFAQLNGYTCHTINANWDEYGKRAGYIRNVEMANISQRLVAFWDGRSRGTENMIKIAMQQNIPTLILRYEESDILLPHIGRVRNKHTDPGGVYIGRGAEWGNPFPLEDKADPVERLESSTKYIHYVMTKHPKFLTDPNLMEAESFSCYCSPKLCHGDALAWAQDNMIGTKVRYPLDIRFLKLLKPWPKKIKKYVDGITEGADRTVCHEDGTPLANSYSRIIMGEKEAFIEFFPSEIIPNDKQIFTTETRCPGCDYVRGRMYYPLKKVHIKWSLDDVWNNSMIEYVLRELRPKAK